MIRKVYKTVLIKNLTIDCSDLILLGKGAAEMIVCFLS